MSTPFWKEAVMENREIINRLMKNPSYFSLQLPQRLQMTRFIRDCGFDPGEIDEIFLQSFTEDLSGPAVFRKD